MGCISTYLPIRKLLRLLLFLLTLMFLGIIFGLIRSDGKNAAIQGKFPSEMRSSNEDSREPIIKETLVVTPKVDRDISSVERVVPNTTFVYFIIPKCGSRTLFYLVSNLKEKNGWGEVSALTKLVKERRRDRTSMVQEYVDNATRPAFLYVDTSFVPLRDSGDLVYISLIRDPLERFLSAYYFEKSGDGIQGPDTGLKGKYERDYFSHCQKSRRNDTCFGHWLGKTIHPRFCGVTSICSQMARKTIERAKRIASQTFSVVGILEEFDKFLQLLEKKYPAHFKGFYEMYQKSETREFVSKVKTKEKERPRPDIIEKMKEDMKLDYEFYGFVKDQFHKQLDEMDIR
ncbi:putative uronyl 2-sulfotransferase [Apostichopus japonicus]|uniref:Putative uronyl 2-sulfotransferase n=1 Tax=Stichopus japonicus TaxID=307972 RepID=A0A2G8L7H3_STIJA|nr:putative uronyl 2-sulfotransferase [Apostichopus japonicus]